MSDVFDDGYGNDSDFDDHGFGEGQDFGNDYFDDVDASGRGWTVIKDGNLRGKLCPVERGGGLDNKIRRWLQNPRRILKPCVEKGMTVLEIGCGPGFFTIDMAEMVGESGRVIASDLQTGRLEKVKDKIRGTELEKRIGLHKSEENKIGVVEPVDFVLLFYGVHEISDKETFFRQVASVLKPNGKALVCV